MTNEGRSIRTEIDEERLERLAQAPLVDLILACEDLDDAADTLKGNDYMWDRVVGDVAKNADRISSEETADEVCRQFLNAVSRYASLGKMPEDSDEDEGDGSNGGHPRGA